MLVKINWLSCSGATDPQYNNTSSIISDNKKHFVCMTTEEEAQNALNQCHSKINRATSVGGLEDNPAYSLVILAPKIGLP